MMEPIMEPKGLMGDKKKKSYSHIQMLHAKEFHMTLWGNLSW